MKRREFIAGLGGTVAWPVVAHAQRPNMPVIGFLSSESSDVFADRVLAFRRGLAETGYVEGQNLSIEYRWANGKNELVAAMAVDLVSRDVNLIAATTTPSALAAKRATTTIPIVFALGSDPVQLGLVASMNRPGANATGIVFLTVELVQKRLELLHELIPTATNFALLVNPANHSLAETAIRDVQAGARTLGLQLRVLQASTERDLDLVFGMLKQQRAGALVVGPDPFFSTRAGQLGVLARRYQVPAIFQLREFALAGGLLSYETNISDAYRQSGAYVGRILKGEKPAELPVQQSTKIELVINVKTAKALGLDVPLVLLARADEVIE
jgi:putative tryptophan/tyrosine transport system substrate-binding protein